MFKHDRFKVADRTLSTDKRDPSINKFNSKNSSCCCNSIHIKQGVLLIGIVSFVIFIFSLSSLPFSTTSSPFVFYLQFFLLLLDLVAIFLLFKAFYTNSHLLLLPFIFVETLYTLSLILGVAICIYAFLNPTDNITKLLVYSFFDPITTENEHKDEVGGSERHVADEITVAEIMTAVGALTMTTCALVCFWWTSVTISCYFYFRDLKAHKQNDKQTDGCRASSYNVA